ncbi:hypothetical protein ACQPYH_09155 [Kribbella sp. CA-245084]|uniref:hypothetical protein n=1 Tax=Kribbella sp. CA-245084 TaxID=3239940 RepID=UPI003D8F6405
MTVTPAANDGPVLCTAMTKRSLFPATTVVADAVLWTLRLRTATAASCGLIAGASRPKRVRPAAA